MDVVSSFKISYDRKRLVFYPGEHITGHVEINLLDPTEMQGLTLTFTGKASCGWKEKTGSGAAEFIEKKKFLEETRCLFGSEKPVENTELLIHPAGKRKYDFSFMIPATVPSSFEGSFGFIRYKMEAICVRPDGTIIRTCELFSVNDIVDANAEEYTKDAGGENNKPAGCLPFTRSPVEMTARAERSCYCPGETIFIDASLTNVTKKQLNGMHAKILQTVTYEAQGKSKTDTQESPRMTNNTPEWNRQAFDVGPIPPSVSNCSIISVQYQLEIVASVKMRGKVSVKIPITIGTIPCTSYSTNQNTLEPYMASMVGEYTPLQPSNFGHTEMAPPSYTTVKGCNIDLQKGRKENDKKITFGYEKYTPFYTFAKPHQKPLDEKED